MDPGGRFHGGRHVQFVSEMPDETDPEKHLAGFRGKGVDVYISVDANEMRRDGIPIYRSVAGVLLGPQAVPVEYYKWLNLSHRV